MEANWAGILLAILGIAGMVVGAWATTTKDKSKAEAEQLITNAKIQATDAEMANKKSEAEIKERDDLFGMIKELTGQNKEQTKQGKDFLDSLGKIREEKEADYQTLKNLSDSNTQIVISEVQRAHSAMIAEIRALDTTIQSSKNNWIETVASEFASVLASKFNEQMMLQTQYPFPSSSDADWTEDFVKPIVNHAWLYNRPLASEGTRSPVEIKVEGENLELIRGWKKDWIAVRFARSNKAVFGWVQEHEIRIGLAAIRSTGETPVVTAMNPLAAAT
ncbi:MAG: hypothetical protein H0X30_01420 [Anaerolineae bacterium]|nr:hypothetical protein [Anaerolineae bacterium]